MDLEQIFNFIRDRLIVQWPFFVVSFSVGTAGQFAKTRLWTKTRASVASPRWFWFWGRATLPLHAPLAGALIGVVLCLLYGEQAPCGPGVVGQGQILLYYTGAGALSVLVYDAVKKVARSRGLSVDGRRSEDK